MMEERRVEDSLKLIAEKHNAIIEEVKISHGNNPSAEITIDCLEEGQGSPGVDFLAELSREFSVAIEKLGIFPGAHHVRVSSPGVERPLVTGRHWEKAVGRLVKLTLDGAENIVVRLDGFDPERGEITVREKKLPRRGVSGSYHETKNIALAEIKRAHVEVEF